MSSRTDAGATRTTVYRRAIIGLTVVALFLRIPGLGDGLWADEIFSILESFRTPFPQSLGEFPGDNKHPLYSLMAHACLVLLGEHPWSVRLPALFFGVASVPLLHSLGRQIAGPAAALASAALLAVSYHHVWFSQNARGYTMLAFWTMLGTLLLLRGVRQSGRTVWVLYGIVSALGAYTHLTYVFSIAGQAVAVLVAGLITRGHAGKPGWRGPLTGFATAALTTLALYAPMLDGVVRHFLYRESNLKGISTPTWALSEALRVLRLGLDLPAAAGVALVLLATSVGLVGMINCWRRDRLATLAMLLPALATVAGALLARGTMYPRFFFAFVGFALLILMSGMFTVAAAVAGWMRLSHPASMRPGAIAAVMLTGLSAMSLSLNWRVPKQDFEGAMHFAESSAREGEVIATADVTSLVYGPFYRRDWRALKNGEDLETLRTGRTVWLLYTFPRYLERFDPAVSEVAARECGTARRFRGTVGGGDVIVCRLAAI